MDNIQPRSFILALPNGGGLVRLHRGKNHRLGTLPIWEYYRTHVQLKSLGIYTNACIVMLADFS